MNHIASYADPNPLYRRDGMTRFCNLVFLLTALILSVKATGVMIFQIHQGAWNDYTDCLYNYGGGMIRRGLTGELLFAIKDILHLPLLPTVYSISIICYIAAAWYVIRHFRRHGYGLNVLIMGFLLGAYLLYSIDVMRRDYWIIALFAAMVSVWRSRSPGIWIVTGNLIAILAILLHEASFFFIVPISILMTRSRGRNLINSILSWLPSIFVFLLCCHFKGTQEMLYPIAQRASAYAPEALAAGPQATALHFIGDDASELMIWHLSTNFTDSFAGTFIPVGILTILYILYVPWLTVAMLRRFSKSDITYRSIGNLLSLFALQFVSLIPMFTFLSCDIGRVCLYWIMTSVMVWISAEDTDIERMFCPQISKRTQVYGQKIFRHVPAIWVLTLLMLSVGIPLYERQPGPMFHSSPIGQLYSSAEKALQVIDGKR